MASVYRTGAGRDRVRQWCDDRLAALSTPHDRSIIPTVLGETHLLAAGSGDTTVLYLPGTNFTAANSLPLVTALAQDHRVVVADLPGQPGLSTGERPRGDRFSAYGAWVDGLVAHLSAEHLVLSGHSLGAACALAAEPSATVGIVLVDPAGLIRLRASPAVLGATLPWLLRPTPGRSARLLQHMHGVDRRPSPAEVSWMTLVARHTRSTFAPPPLPLPLVERWRVVPRMVLSGEHDCFLPVRPLRSATRRKLGTDLQVLADAGHLVPDERPESVVTAVVAVRDGPTCSASGQS